MSNLPKIVNNLDRSQKFIQNDLCRVLCHKIKVTRMNSKTNEDFLLMHIGKEKCENSFLKFVYSSINYLRNKAVFHHTATAHLRQRR